MSLREQLTNDMKQAMRDRNNELRDTIRYVLSVVKNAEIDKREPLTEEEELAVLRTQAKQRQDSMTQFESGNRPDLVDRERSQLSILEHYLPTQMTDQELSAFVQAGIEDTEAKSPKEMGQVMGLLNRRAEGRVDGRRLSAAVKAALAQ